jgi:hypothetical protein
MEPAWLNFIQSWNLPRRNEKIHDKFQSRTSLMRKDDQPVQTFGYLTEQVLDTGVSLCSLFNDVISRNIIRCTSKCMLCAEY